MKAILCAVPLQKRNGMMDPDDFRACLISMGYDLVSGQAWLVQQLERSSNVNYKDLLIGLRSNDCWLLLLLTGWGGVCTYHDPGGPQQHGRCDLPGLHRLHDPWDRRDRHCRTSHGLLQDSGFRQGEQMDTASAYLISSNWSSYLACTELPV